MTTDTPQAGPFRLLALADDTSAVNRMLSAVRQNGLDIQARLAANLTEAEALLSSDAPELLLYFSGQSPVTDALPDMLHKHELAIPVILVTPAPPTDDQLPALLARGFHHVVDTGQPGRLTALVLLEARHGMQQRRLRSLGLALRELEQRHQRLLDDSPLAVAYLRDGMHLYCNAAYATQFGFDSRESACATPLLNLVPETQRDALRCVLEGLHQGDESQSFTGTGLTGSNDAVRFDFRPVSFEGKRCQQVTVQAAAGNANHARAVADAEARDLLTSLDSRSHFFARVEGAIRRAIQEQRTSALIVLELDNVDEISEVLGRTQATRLVQAVATELPRLLAMPFAAGRLDLHCFGILLEEREPDRVLDLCRHLEQGLTGTGHGELTASLGLQVRCGMMLVNGNALDAEDLVAKARVAGRRLPATGKGPRQYRISDSLDVGTGDMLAYLGSALEARRFQPVFQPIVGLGQQSRRCYELLIRMLDLDGNQIPPADFIPLATINGLGEALDRVVAEIAIEALAEADGRHQLNINITESTLLSRTFLPWLSEHLRATPGIADRLLVDISEINLHALQQSTLDFCKGLGELGIGVAVSNFGCALEPLALVRGLKPCFVTLDTSLVRNLMYSTRDQAQIKQLIRQLHAEGLEVVIPRVENMASLPLLWDLGADYIQGFSVQAPRHAMDFEFVQDQEITLTAPGPAGSDLHAG